MALVDSLGLSPSTPSVNQTRFSTAARFQESTHLIPTPGAYKKAQRHNPVGFWLPVIVGVPGLCIAIAIGLEIGVQLSNKNTGFGVPSTNIFAIVSQQFLLSFFPNTLILPFAIALRELDWMLRWYHPYVLLSKGNARAEESLLMDYVHAGPFLSMFYGLKFKHRVVFWSAFAAMVTYAFQPLAGALFTIIQLPHSIDTNVTSINQIGLNQNNINDRTAFVASAGFVQTAVFNSLPDPPFIKDSWAVAEFVFPNYAGFNGSVVVKTSAIDTDPQCNNPLTTPQITPGPTSNQALVHVQSATNSACQLVVTLNGIQPPSQQYGVQAVGTDTGCTNITDIEKQPVLFWFFHTRADNNAQEARAVLCAPALTAFEVTASANLVNGNFTGVQKDAPYTAANNVTGPPLNAQPFNAVVFNNSTDPFVHAREVATQNGVPGAIFRSAFQKGIQTVFDEPNGFLDLTNSIYAQHLALTAKGIYFLPVNQTIAGAKTSSVPRLIINGLPARLLAFLLLAVGLTVLIVQLMHRRLRSNLLLAAPPGSIASTTALTARSGFGQLLYPYDNAEALEKKLSGLRFRLDERTGAIVAEDAMYDEDAIGLEEKDTAKHSLLYRNKGRPRATSKNTTESEEIGLEIEDLDIQTLARQSRSSLVHTSESSTYFDHTLPPGPSSTEYRPMSYQPMPVSTRGGYPPPPRSS